MKKVRLNIEVSEDLANFLDDLADDEVVTRTEIVRRALAVLKAYKEQIGEGNTHIGFARNPGGLDAELVGVLTSPLNAGEAESDTVPARRRANATTGADVTDEVAAE